jgi:hypothetical protein
VRPRDALRPFLLRRVTARRPERLRSLALAAAADAWRTELRLVGPGVPALYTDLSRLQAWPGRGLPEEDPSSLWRDEVEMIAAADLMIGKVEEALEAGRRAGAITPAGAARVVALAEELAVTAASFR